MLSQTVGKQLSTQTAQQRGRKKFNYTVGSLTGALKNSSGKKRAENIWSFNMNRREYMGKKNA